MIDSGETVAEDFWRLPISSEHKDAIKGKLGSDLRNVAGSRYGGASHAAAFLERFIEPE